MATRSSSGRRSGGFLPFFLGFLLALVLVAAGGWAYLHFGHLPVSTGDPAFPFEAQVVHVPLHARIAGEMKHPPFGISEDVFEAGARVYRAQCAECHGTPGHDRPYARYMFPKAPQLWKKHTASSVVGVSDDEPGETYWKIANGIRLSGMPSYQHLLSDTQMWQVTLLLKNADQPLPDPVQQILNGPPAK
ncbi:cytochrome c [Granulicella sp. WH15]|uniref:c-type cytochrome n=1 Tax=Granulicella sp. WH15 TaxID=2602070 RepID=UPI0013676D02|nr:cytochrome c [Granulicella sp. WH15]QHN02492.1 cytochrome c [Granulicella sp. WH15]